MRILTIEDDQYKLDNLLEFLQKKCPTSEISVAKSVSSSIKAVSNDSFDLIILDMSLPTFDVSPSESGGKPQGFGGVDILRFLEAQDFEGVVVVVTQFEKFGDAGDEKDLSILRQELLEEFPQILKSVIYFDPALKAWQSDLASIIANVRSQQ